MSALSGSLIMMGCQDSVNYIRRYPLKCYQRPIYTTYIDVSDKDEAFCFAHYMSKLYKHKHCQSKNTSLHLL